MQRAFFVSLLMLCAGLLLAGCKESTVGPDLTGAISGTVLDAETNEPLANAQVTTSPPTSAIVTDADGAFQFETVDTGNYTVTAGHTGYASKSVTIAVRENETAQATLFLETEEDDSSSDANLDVNITSSATRMKGDSSFVEVDYRVRNTGGTDVALYEVDFRIETSSETFFVQERGEDLLAGQSDVGSFEEYTRRQPATDVAVDQVTFEEATPSSS